MADQDLDNPPVLSVRPNLSTGGADNGSPESSQTPKMPAYDPNAAQPYAAPKLPEITPPAQRDPSSMQQPQVGHGGMGGGAKGTIGTIAYMADSVLRGAMRGREEAEKKKFVQAKRAYDAAQYSHQNDAEKYFEIIRSGKAPDSPEAKGAEDAVRESDKRVLQAYRTLSGADQKGKKKKGQSGDQPENPMEMIKSKDPQEVTRGILMVREKAGPPALYQGQQIWRQMQAKANDPAQQEAADRAAVRQIVSIPEANRTPQQKAELERLMATQKGMGAWAAAGKTATGSSTPHDSSFSVPGSAMGSVKADALGNPIDPKGEYRKELRDGKESWFPVVAKQPTPTTGAKKVQDKVEEFKHSSDPALKQKPDETPEQWDKRLNAKAWQALAKKDKDDEEKQALERQHLVLSTKDLSNRIAADKEVVDRNNKLFTDARSHATNVINGYRNGNDAAKMNEFNRNPEAARKKLEDDYLKSQGADPEAVRKMRVVGARSNPMATTTPTAGPKQSHPSAGKKVATNDDILAYMDKHQVTYEQAVAAAKGAGYEVK